MLLSDNLLVLREDLLSSTDEIVVIEYLPGKDVADDLAFPILHTDCRRDILNCSTLDLKYTL